MEDLDWVRIQCVVQLDAEQDCTGSTGKGERDDALVSLKHARKTPIALILISLGDPLQKQLATVTPYLNIIKDSLCI